jgi:hypothetical protein
MRMKMCTMAHILNRQKPGCKGRIPVAPHLLYPQHIPDSD